MRGGGGGVNNELMLNLKQLFEVTITSNLFPGTETITEGHQGEYLGFVGPKELPFHTIISSLSLK